jgi:hypothetical protein
MNTLRNIWEANGADFKTGVQLLIDNNGSQLVTTGILLKLKNTQNPDAYLRGKLADALGKIPAKDGVKFTTPPVEKITVKTGAAETEPVKKKPLSTQKPFIKNTRTTMR